jgi:hypothetical protein
LVFHVDDLRSVALEERKRAFLESVVRSTQFAHREYLLEEGTIFKLILQQTKFLVIVREHLGAPDEVLLADVSNSREDRRLRLVIHVVLK